jgi:chromosome segregation ATPase
MEQSTQPEVGENLDAQPEATSEVSQQTENVETTETTASPPKLKVKYNKEERELSYDEAREYAEKGMNYDKIKGRLEETETQLNKWEQGEIAKAVRLYAKDMGISEAEVGKMLLDQFDKRVAEREELPPEVTKQRRELEERATQAESKAQQLEREKAEREQQEAEIQKAKQQLETFVDKHKDVKIAELPQKVKDLWNKTGDLEEAYQTYISDKSKEDKIAELERKLQKMSEQINVTETNTENAEASTGALGKGATLEKELTLEEINDMTPEQLKKNHERIARFYGWR